jgi:NADPH:quinone reductase-like Zn-dependent oxidoreductase
MRAVRIHEFGGPEVLRIDDVPRPVPGEGEVLVRVIAASVNPIDLKIRQGGFIPREALPVAMGRDVAGAVDMDGPGVAEYPPGTAVYAMLEFDRGGQAEFVAVKAAHVAHKPFRTDFIHAAAVPAAGLTAWQGLFEHGRLTRDQRVLIHGAAGGVGHLAVQFADHAGALVSATCAERDRRFVKSLGAAEVISYDQEEFDRIVRNVDMVFDVVGGEVQARSWKVLRPGGVLVSTVQEPDQTKAAEHSARGVFFQARPDGEQLSEIARIIDRGQAFPHVHKVFLLDEVAMAHRELERRQVKGKIVLEVR